MRKSLGEPISVVYFFDAKHKRVKPYQLTWNNTDYRLGPVDFWHKTHVGGVLIHHFSLCDISETIYFKLALNTSNLHWELEELMMASDMNLEYGGQGL